MKTTIKRALPNFSAIASATGCVPATGRVYLWENSKYEANTGHCAKLTIQSDVHGLLAQGFEQKDNALEALAVQLETMAAKVRAMKGKS